MLGEFGSCFAALQALQLSESARAKAPRQQFRGFMHTTAPLAFEQSGKPPKIGVAKGMLPHQAAQHILSRAISQLVYCPL